MKSSRIQEPEWILPFEGMSVGDSFFIPTLTPAEMTYVIDTRAKFAKVRVRVYTRVEDSLLGVRVWRIA
jgi:hypothetical protein